MGLIVGPRLGRGNPCFVCDYPASQAALARLKPGLPRVAARFELYLDGLELANGFHELAQPEEQRARFTHDLALRAARGQVQPPLDEHFLAALGERHCPTARASRSDLTGWSRSPWGRIESADAMAFSVDNA